jgi:hypothetical protein
MNSWARTRKRIILFILFLILVALVGVPSYFLFRTTPTCSDGAQNGDETGVDCGGGCQKLCAPESLPIVMEGDARIIRASASTYEVAALLENPNQDARVRNARYTISLFAPDSLTPVKTIEGSVYVPKGARFAVFEGPFAIDGAAPTRALLAWDESSLAWEKDAAKTPSLTVRQTEFSRLDSAPRLSAEVVNQSPTDGVKNIDLTALIFDAQGNIVAASKTFLDALAPADAKQVIFTWPAPLATAPVEIQILASVLPQ